MQKQKKLLTKARCFAAQVERQSIDLSPLDWFPAIAVWNRNDSTFGETPQ